MLLPLFPVATNTPAATIRIRCECCQTETRYELAQQRGWMFDPAAGGAFKAYRCPDCASDDSMEAA